MNSNEFVYRIASIKDKDQLKQLGISTYGEYKSLLTPENWERLHGNLQNEEKLIELINQSTCFVCEYQNTIIGMAYFIASGNPWDIFIAEWSYIRMVGVAKEYTGKGIGKKLTSMCIEHAKKTNEKTIALHTSEFMDAARHIYECLGFTISKEIEPRLGKRYWLYTLSL